MVPQINLTYLTTTSIMRTDTIILRIQDVAVVKTEAFGTVLLLDGVIQCTDKDEFSYQEMIAHLPTCALPVSDDILVW